MNFNTKFHNNFLSKILILNIFLYLASSFSSILSPVFIDLLLFVLESCD